MRRFRSKRFDERALKAVLVVFFLALAVPAGVLIAQAYSQLKWQAFRSTQVAAEDLAARIDASLRAAAAVEDARSFGDYSFLVVEGDVAANFVQRSPLSAFPVETALPGVLGWFQVDAAGNLTTPLLPAPGLEAADYGITPAEEAARAQRVAQLRDLLAQNELVRASRDEPAAVAEERDGFREAGNEAEDLGAVAAERQRAQLDDGAVLSAGASRPPAPSAQANFDRLATEVQASAGAEPSRRDTSQREALSREAVVSALRVEESTQTEARSKRVEQELVAESIAPKLSAPADVDENANADVPKAEVAVRTFASEIDPFELGVLDTGHLVLFRNVWREGQRFVQGALLDRDVFVATAIEMPYVASSVAGATRLGVAFQGRPVDWLLVGAYDLISSNELAGTVLHRARLSPPFGDVELRFLVGTLPPAPGAALLAWVAVTLSAVLIGGFYLMYRFGAGQMRLARQQQDFVSAVSHELKTPLTSIRMYGEMLKAGWADDAKRQTYYDYIHSESERLSRLIENVLQLARLTRNTQRFDLKTVTVAELVDLARSKVATQVERAGFTLVVRNETPEGTTVVVDADCAAQIFINLVDNALKFSAGAADKRVELAARRNVDGSVIMTVRDYGPGVPKTQLKKIFELFYRAENELTRDTAGTGIGLALVRQLAAAMDARVDARNCEPGAEFRVELRQGANAS